MTFNPDEPRDERGRWTGDGAPALAGASWRDKPLFDKSSAGRGAALAMHANLSMRETFRHRPRWSDPASGESLGRLLPRWNAAARLDDETFRDRYLGNRVGLDTVHAIRAATETAMRARTAGDMARAGSHLAIAIRAVGIENWPRFLTVAETEAAAAPASIPEEPVVLPPGNYYPPLELLANKILAFQPGQDISDLRRQISQAYYAKGDVFGGNEVNALLSDIAADPIL
jgi:hypothetical protein